MYDVKKEIGQKGYVAFSLDSILLSRDQKYTSRYEQQKLTTVSRVIDQGVDGRMGSENILGRLARGV
jgi:hypothetical protein